MIVGVGSRNAVFHPDFAGVVVKNAIRASAETICININLTVRLRFAVIDRGRKLEIAKNDADAILNYGDGKPVFFLAPIYD